MYFTGNWLKCYQCLPSLRCILLNFLERFYGLHVFFFLMAVFIAASEASGDNNLKVGISLQNPPLSFIEKNELPPKGFNIDLANTLAAQMGLTCEIITMNESNLIAALNDGDVDFVIGIKDNSYTTVFAIETSVRISRSYFINSQFHDFDASKDISEYTVAIEMGNNLSWFLTSKRELNFLVAETQEEALAYIDSGKAEVYISKDSGSTRYIIDKMGLKNVKQVELPIETVPLVLAVKKNNTELSKALSVALGKTIEEGVYKKIYNQWLGKNLIIYDQWFGMRLRKVIFRYRNHIISALLCVIFVFLMFVIWNFLLKKKVVQINKKFRVSEQRYRDLIESSPDMIHLVSRKGEIKLTNKIAKKYLGFNEKEMITLRLHDLVISEQMDNVTNFLDDVFRNKYSNKEFTFFSKKGDKIDVEMIATILKDDESPENLACCFSRDLTYRKRLEAELIHSDRLAVIGQMAAGIAHEINSPLWVILSNAKDAIAYNQNKDEVLECLETIERSGTRAAKFIEGLLTFSRPTPMKFIAIDLVNIIKDSLVFLKQKLKTKNIRVEEIYFSDSILINGDESSIQQLIFNIILNAIQAIDKNGLITISVEVDEENGKKEIILEVMDNGRGIPDEDLQSVFDPFFTSGKANGFGLGLFMSRMIVEKHHGRLSAKSQLGKGTIITACFPEILELSFKFNM